MEQFPRKRDRGPISHLLWQAGIFTAFFAQFVKMRLAYRVDFFIDTLAVTFSLVVQLAVLTVLFSKVEALQGWTFEQVLFIYGFSLLPLGLFNLVSVNLYRFSERYIIEGRFDRVLLRPLGTLPQVMFESFNVSGLNELLIGSVVMAYSLGKLQTGFGVVDALAVALLAPAAALVYTGVFLALTSISFWHEDRMGLAPPVYNVIRFSRFPLTIYGQGVRLFLTFVLPFAWVAFYPASWFLGREEFSRFALLTVPMGLVVFGGALVIWQRGVRRYASTGS